jgi:hypothetical protein
MQTTISVNGDGARNDSSRILYFIRIQCLNVYSFDHYQFNNQSYLITILASNTAFKPMNSINMARSTHEVR